MEPARIMIVDDQPAFAHGLRALLLAEAPKDNQVIELAHSGTEAISLSEEFVPHLILMDIGLPDMTGIEATSLIKQVSPSTVVVMLTASDEEADLLSALKAGASGYLLKTLDLEEIAIAVESILHGNLVIPAHLAGAIRSALATASEEVASRLTGLQEKVIAAITAGASNERIAGMLGISQEEVAKQISNIYSKLHVTTKAAAIAEAIRRGLG